MSLEDIWGKTIPGTEEKQAQNLEIRNKPVHFWKSRKRPLKEEDE